MTGSLFRSTRAWGLLALGIAALLSWQTAGAQERSAATSPSLVTLTTIPSSPQFSETHTDPRPIVEVASDPKLPNWTPNYSAKTQTLKSKAENTVFRPGQIIEQNGQVAAQSSIWNLEFAFKPLRMIEVDVPQPSGKLQRKRLWYMVYRVTNYGLHQSAEPVLDDWKHATYKPVSLRHPIYFFPHFVMRVHVPSVALENGQRVTRYESKEYLDRVIPAAMKPIAERERVGAKIHDSVSISRVPIEVSQTNPDGTLKTDRSVWGAVVWEEIDPRADFLSVFVQGLTNAYQFEDPAGAFKPGDPPGTGRVYKQKTLQLNFWRPGDAVHQHEQEIRYGLPHEKDPQQQQKIQQLYGVSGPLDHQWVYR